MAKINYLRTFVYPLIPAGAYVLLTFLDQYPTIQSITFDLPNFTYNFLKIFGGIYLVVLSGLLGLTKYVKVNFGS